MSAAARSAGDRNHCEDDWSCELGAVAGAHYHRTFTESFHVLSGTVEFYDGQQWFAARPGGHVVVLEGGVDVFRSEAEESATMLMQSTPGVRREDFFGELIALLREDRRLSPQEWADFFARHDQSNL
jgi:hypothetical protein